MIEPANLQTAPLKRHSRIGVTSFIIGVGLPVLMTVFIVVIASLDTKKSSGNSDIVFTLLIISLTFPLLHILGLTLGIVALFFKTTKKSFAVAGTILNAVFLLVGIGLVYLALMLLSAASGFR